MDIFGSNNEIVAIQLWEWVALPIYIFFILFLAYFHQKRKKKENPVYKYYLWGLALKIMGAILFVIIYYFYYSGGDTIDYYASSLNLTRLLFESPFSWFHIEFGAVSNDNYALFTSATGSPYIAFYFDYQTLTLLRIINLVIIPGLGSFLLSTIVLTWVAYSGIWKLYLVFTNYYPTLQGKLAIAILFFPSVLFWGSGIMKDTLTLSFSGWIVYCIYMIFIIKRRRFPYTVILLFMMATVLLIKPYIVIALLPGTFVWIFSEKISGIRNTAAKILIIPFIIISCAGISYLIFSSLGDYMGKFALDKISTTLTVTASDLKQDYYQGHAFDIGTVSNSPTEYVKKVPAAIIAGLYRPFIWEAGNIVMLFSGMENIFLLLFTLFIFVRISPKRFFQRLFHEPLLFFAYSYSLFFSYAVGLSTSNFGALVRFKIAYLPFFVAVLFILNQRRKKNHEDEHEEIDEQYLINNTNLTS